MEREQFEIMDRVEGCHWWYLALRDLLERLWQRADLRLPAGPSVIDAGCGSGGNLHFFQQLLRPGYLAGFDCSPIALAAASRKCPEAHLFASDICQPELPERSWDVVFSCDVIYVTGLEAARPGLERLARALNPGGQLVLHVPAYSWLTSGHDRAVHTRERFVLPQMLELLNHLQLQTQVATYRLCGFLPLLVLKRMPSILARRSAHRSSELELPPAWVNGLLLRFMQLENRIIARGGSLPMGSSILVIGRNVCPQPRPGKA